MPISNCNIFKLVDQRIIILVPYQYSEDHKYSLSIHQILLKAEIVETTFSEVRKLCLFVINEPRFESFLLDTTMNETCLLLFKRDPRNDQNRFDYLCLKEIKFKVKSWIILQSKGHFIKCY